jgi:hypothetical protein
MSHREEIFSFFLHSATHLGIAVGTHTVHATLFMYFPSLEDIFILLRHVSVQWNHLQAIYIGFYGKYYT